MEEVRSYWQVASIQHFCALFQKPFKLPSFEPEELEQAFIIDIPEPPKSNHTPYNSNIYNINNNSNGNDDEDDEEPNQQGGDDNAKSDPDYDSNLQDPLRAGMSSSRNSSSNHLSNDDCEPIKPPSNQVQQQQQQPNEDQQELHLLVKLAIALIKPHFNTKISFTNYENYLRRLIEQNWVELEHCPSPLSVPFISPDGIELSRNLGLRDLPLGEKIDIFSALCDYRLWCEDASDLLKDYPLDELRLESIGKDSHGFEYWYFSGTRLFREDIEVNQDLICRKKRIKELEYKLIECEKARILKEQEDKRKAEMERAKQLANEAREARLAAKRQQDQEAAATNRAKRKRTGNIPNLPPRTGLRERRSSATGNNSESQSRSQSPTPTPTRTLRSRTKPQEQVVETTPRSSQKTTRGSAKNSKLNDQPERSKTSTPDVPKKSLEEECREELERIMIKQDERAAAWCVICESLEEWENFPKKFEKTKSTNEKYLANHINNVLLPHIQGIYAKRAAEIRRKEKELLLSLATRRVSTRIISKRAQEEEEERQAQIREAEIQKKKAEAEIRLRAELEREMKAKKDERLMNGGASSACSQDNEEPSGRYNLRQNQHDIDDETIEFEGIVHPDRLAEFYEALELIVDTVRTSKHAWPFVDPVPDTVPGYYDLIDKPMDLKTLRTKVEFRHYKSLIELEKDFQLLVNNCEKFNGPRNVYTKMVYKLWKSFRKNVQLYLQRDLHMNEQETFLYPPVVPVAAPPPPPLPPVEEAKEEPIQSPPTQNGVTKEEKVERDNSEVKAGSPIHNHHQEVISNGAQPIESLKVEEANHAGTGVKVETCGDDGKKSESNNIAENHVATDSISTLETHKTTTETKLTLQYEPTPIDIPMSFVDMQYENPPEPVVEEVIIDSYAETCPEDNIYVWQQDNNMVDH